MIPYKFGVGSLSACGLWVVVCLFAVAVNADEFSKPILLQLAQLEDPLRARPKRATQHRFVSLRSDEVNVRVGPGVRYPVKWVFRQKAIPVEIVQEYDTWRKIRDWEGAEGWCIEPCCRVNEALSSPANHHDASPIERRSARRCAFRQRHGCTFGQMHPRLVSGRGRRLRRLGSARRPLGRSKKQSLTEIFA